MDFHFLLTKPSTSGGVKQWRNYNFEAPQCKKAKPKLFLFNKSLRKDVQTLL